MWGRSVIERLGFWRLVTSTRKAEVLEETKKETRLQHHFRIVNIIEKHNIPKFHLLNSDQAPSKYVTIGSTTIARNSTRVGLAVSANKRSITFALTVTLDGKKLPDNLWRLN